MLTCENRWVLAAANFSAECSPLFDYEALINTISARFMTDKRHIDSYCLEAQAILYNCLGNVRYYVLGYYIALYVCV